MARPSQYTAPPLDASNSDKLGWFREAAQEGEDFLKSQRSWSSIDKAVDIIMGSADPKIPRGMSKLSINMIKRDVRESVSTLANMRPLWGFKTDNDNLNKQVGVLNKMLRAWYYEPHVRTSIRSILQYSLGTGKGYAYPTWRSDAIVSGRGDIYLGPLGPRDVLPYGLGRDNDLQRAYTVVLDIETPVQQAMAMYPTQIDLLTPDRSTPTWMRKGARRVQRFLSPLLNAFGPGAGKEKPDSTFPTVHIFHAYTLDLSTNMTGKTIKMGATGTNWEYEVPDYKSMIPSGEYNKEGKELYREATIEDAKLFPLRRLTVFTEKGILGDGSSPWWHGMCPAVPFVTDDWPWDFLGVPMTHDADSIQQSANRLGRVLDDVANVKLDPPIAYDENMSQSLIERFNPRKPGQRIKLNLTMSDAIKPVLGEGYYSFDQAIMAWVDSLYEKLHYILGTRDIQAIAKAKQVPAGDSLEKMMELAGPILTDMSMNIESSMVQTGQMWKGLAFQFYDVKRRVQLLGRDGVTEEDYDYDPANMIPSHTDEEFEKIKQNQALAQKNGGTYEPPTSRLSRVQRAKMHINSFTLHSTPNSMHQITQLTKKLLYMQLFKAGFPIDPWSVAEAMEIDNYGTPNQIWKILDLKSEADIPDDKFGRWIVWLELQKKLGVGGPQKGRPQSHQQSGGPTQKDGGTRTVDRTSPR